MSELTPQERIDLKLLDRIAALERRAGMLEADERDIDRADAALWNGHEKRVAELEEITRHIGHLAVCAYERTGGPDLDSKPIIDRMLALEREDSARKGLEHEHEERLHALEQLGEHLGERVLKLESAHHARDVLYNGSWANDRATAPLPTTAIKLDTTPRYGGMTLRESKLADIEEELGKLGTRMGVLRGEREKLRTP